jgi:integrase
MREAGLGPAIGPSSGSLASAREKARELHVLVRQGKDPLDEGKSEKARAKADAALISAKAMTFDQCSIAYIAAHETAWRNAKHRAQWRSTLETYAAPIFGSLPVAAIDTGFVMRAIEPIWTTKPETASRLRGRIESVLDWARVRGYREGENPARWRGHLDQLLPARSKVRTVKHHAALPWRDVPTFMQYLNGFPAGHISALAMKFTILTAARTGEIIGAQWNEFDFKARIWTVPASRMKAGREHRVPLSEAAMDVLENMPRIKGESRVFPISNMAMAMLLRRLGIEATVHGFRSSFRDWAAESTNFPREICEAALAHTVGSKVELAYLRSDLFAKRARLMSAWADYCNRPVQVGEVISLMERKKA